MERSRIVSDIYGYLVCLLSIVVFLAATAGFVNNAFQAVHPTPHRLAMMHPGMMRRGNMMYRFGTHPRDPRSPLASPSDAKDNAAAMPPWQGTMNLNRAQMRGMFLAQARYEAVRMLVVHLVLMILVLLLFIGHWRWLRSPQTA
jgi:hypothetical protein